MNAPALYERCRPRAGAGLWLKVEPVSPGGFRVREYFYLVPFYKDFEAHWNLEGPCGPEDRHE